MKLIRLICLLLATIGVATAQTAAFDLPTFRVVPDYNTGNPGEIRFLESDGFATGAATDYVALRFSDELGVVALELIPSGVSGHFIPNSAGTQSLGLQLRPWAGIYGKELNLEHPDGGTKFLKFFYGSAGDATVTTYALHFPPEPTPDNAGYVLVFDENGVATWQVNGGGGGGSCPVGADNQVQYYLAGNCGASSGFTYTELQEATSAQANVTLSAWADTGTPVGGQVIGRGARGTIASPTAINGPGASMLRLVGRGYDGTAFQEQIRLRLETAESWSGSARGTRFLFQATPPGSTTLENLGFWTTTGLGVGVPPAFQLDVNGVANFRGNIQPHATNTYTSGTTSLRWSAVNALNLNLTGSITFDGAQDPVISNASSGGSTILSFGGRVSPSADQTWWLGGLDKRWDILHGRQINLGTSTSAQVLIEANAASNLGNSIIVYNTSLAERVKMGVSGSGSTGSLAVLNSTGNTITMIATGNSTTEGFYVGSNRVVGQRITGWGAPSGVANRSTFATSTVTLEQLAQRVKAVIDDLAAHGLQGP